jgi:C-lobe and N-lobe beta barrels of Tf-binding protein B
LGALCLSLLTACGGGVEVVFVSNPDDGKGGGVIIIGGGTSGAATPSLTMSRGSFESTTWNVVGDRTGGQIAAPAAATQGANAGVGPHSCCIAPTGTKFPLLQSALKITSAGVLPDTGTNAAGATLTVLNENTGRFRLDIPSLGIDYEFLSPVSVPFFQGRENLTLAPSNGDVVTLIMDGFSTSRMGAWAVRDGNSGQIKSVAFFTTGIPSPAGSMRTTGTATYRADTESGTVGVVMVPTTGGFSSAALSGRGQLIADFDLGVVVGTLTNMQATDANNVTTPWNDVSVAATIAGGAPSFTGTTAAATAPAAPFALKGTASGQIRGEFYGGSAEQVGAVWSLSDGTGSAIGVFGGKIPSSPGGIFETTGGSVP